MSDGRETVPATLEYYAFTPQTAFTKISPHQGTVLRMLSEKSRTHNFTNTYSFAKGKISLKRLANFSPCLGGRICRCVSLLPSFSISQVFCCVHSCLQPGYVPTLPSAYATITLSLLLCWYSFTWNAFLF